MLVPKRYDGLEIGHMSICMDGDVCNCGRTGCFETYVSMRKFKNSIRKELKLGNSIDNEELREIMFNNMIKIESIIDEYINYLSIGIANLINIFEPEVISIRRKFCIL